MIDLTLGEIADIVGGELIGADPSTRVTGTVEFDSRRITPGCLFLALPGEKVDGHEFVPAALAAGAVAALVARPVDGAAIVVPAVPARTGNAMALAADRDGSGAAVLAALAALAKARVGALVAEHGLTVVGITGSSGKTSTKDLLAQVPIIRDAIRQGASGAPARHLLALLDHLTSVPLAEVQRQYVETFDMRRRCCLHLTYYAYGDTRRRGMALLDLKQTYQRCGATLREDELPDHLCVVLEFSAAYPQVGRTLLLDHRPGLELLRISLTDRDSPYRHGVEAVSATLPTLVGRDLDAVRTLIASGPPDEQVGMEAFVSGGHATERN